MTLSYVKYDSNSLKEEHALREKVSQGTQGELHFPLAKSICEQLLLPPGRFLTKAPTSLTFYSALPTSLQSHHRHLQVTSSMIKHGF